MPETPTWATAVAWATAEIDRLRKRNDAIDLDPVLTATLRGEIQALKRLLALPAKAAQEAAMSAQQ